jgi:hypothetical protein
MGFDPRRWQPPAGSRPTAGPAVTSNVETLLAENDALRREVRRLRQQLQDALHPPGPVTGGRYGGGSYGITAAQVERWGMALARHPRWSQLRIGPPGGLRELVDRLRQQSWNPALSLEQDLDRRSPGLGAELAEALRGPHSRVRWAVRAAFALYGPRAAEWLSDEPLRVVEELLRRMPRGQARGTRTENHSQASSSGSSGSSGRSGSAGSSGGARRSSQAMDPRRAALDLLGLAEGASVQAIKRAYRRLAKAHHPDLGGDGEAFHRLEQAYRLLLS